MQRSALIIFETILSGNDERARRTLRLQATAKPRAKAYRVKPGQNHGSPRLASGHRYLEILPKYSAIPSGERKPLDFCGTTKLMGNEDKSAMGKRKVERERTPRILQLNPVPYQFLLPSLSFFFPPFSPPLSL